MATTDSIPPPFAAGRLLAHDIDSFLGIVAHDRAATFDAGALCSQSAGIAYASPRNIFGRLAMRVSSAPIQFFVDRAEVDVFFAEKLEWSRLAHGACLLRTNHPSEDLRTWLKAGDAGGEGGARRKTPRRTAWAPPARIAKNPEIMAMQSGKSAQKSARC